MGNLHSRLDRLKASRRPLKVLQSRGALRKSDHSAPATTTDTVDSPKSLEYTLAARQHNQAQPIHSLPEELLSGIFMLLISAINLEQDYGRVSEPISSLSMVCLAWRHVILSTPYLWAKICEYDSPAYIRTALKRSKDSPLQLFVECDSPESFDLMFKHVSRWRRVYLRLDPERPLSEAELGTIFDAPILEDLCIHGGSHRDDFEIIGPNRRPPRLRCLGLKYMSVPWTSRLLCNLRVLTLHHDDKIVSVELLHHVLSHNPDLRALDLYFHDNCRITNTETTRLSIVHLPLLVNIHVFLKTPMLAPFLSIISAPNAARVSVCCVGSSEDFEQDAEHIKSSLTPYFANFALVGHLKINISTLGEQAIVLKESARETDDSREVSVRLRHWPTRQLSLDWLLSALGDRARHTTTELVFYQKPDEYILATAEQAFRHLPITRLEAIDLGYGGVINSFLTFIQTQIPHLRRLEQLAFSSMSFYEVEIEKLIAIVSELVVGSQDTDLSNQEDRQLKLLAMQHCCMHVKAHIVHQLESAMAGGVLEIEGTDPRGPHSEASS